LGQTPSNKGCSHRSPSSCTFLKARSIIRASRTEKELEEQQGIGVKSGAYSGTKYRSRQKTVVAASIHSLSPAAFDEDAQALAISDRRQRIATRMRESHASMPLDEIGRGGR
jgi:hypothetical protein